MRELKYRAYIKPLKRYATGIDTIQFHKCCDVEGAGIWTVVTAGEGIFEFDDIIIEQYIGLKDKNGKEIYEGDIILDIMNDIESFVVWDEEKLWFDNNAKPIDEQGRIPYTEMLESASARHFKVIGNIHENPEWSEKEE